MPAAAAAGSIGEALSASIDALAAAGVETPRLDAELLLAEATGFDRAMLVADADRPVSAPQARTFGAMIRRRIVREPVAYILGRRGFRHLELISDRRGLVPRAETELLVEVALARSPGSVLDVGTGSGAIALAVASELPACEVVATDTSPAALALAADNVASLGLGRNVSLVQGTLPPPRYFDLVLANLPYVADRDWPSLPPEITKFEPRGAILGGEDGFDPIRGLLAAFAPSSENAGSGLDCGAIALEIGEGQAEQAGRLLGEAGFPAVETLADLAGIDRVVVGAR